MAVYRRIHVSFWQDPFILDLTPEEKYFYLYLMSNSKTRQCGVYELPKKVAEVETGYNRETVDKLLQRFVDYGKILYCEATKEICLLNWLKYNASKSASVRTCIMTEIAEIKHEPFRQHCLTSVATLYGDSVESVPTEWGEEKEEEEEKEQQQEEEKEDTSADAAEALIAAYNDIFAKYWRRPVVLTPKRRKHIKARLKRFTFDELKQAMQNMRGDPFICGEDPKSTGFHASPEYLFRSDENVEKYLNRKGGRGRGAARNGPTEDDIKFFDEIMR